MKHLKILTCIALIPALTHAADRITDAAFATRSEVFAPHAMAATSQPLVTQIALDTMKRGGNAVDAAIAANAALGLMEPVGSGIGGDLFAIVWDAKTKKLYGLNGSGRSPRSLSLAQLRADLAKRGETEIPPFGPLPVSVPGAVDGWFSLHARFGKLPMKDILAPTIRYAREGFPVSDVISFYWQRNVKRLMEFPGIKEQFTKDGVGPAKGQMWTNPNMAATLETLANEGRDGFYKGDIARKIAAYMKANGGYLDYEDLATHKSEWVEPVSVNYRGYDVWELPPNSQGIAALQMLNLLEAYDLKAAGFGSVNHVHWMAEATKLAFADRAKYYADPNFYLNFFRHEHSHIHTDAHCDSYVYCVANGNGNCNRDRHANIRPHGHAGAWSDGHTYTDAIINAYRYACADCYAHSDEYGVATDTDEYACRRSQR